MFRKLSALVAGVLLCAIASSQSVPNGGTITNGQVWTTPQWINAWQSKFDVTGGSLTGPTITNPAISGGTQSAPTIASPAITGSATLNGSLALTGSSALTIGGSTVPAVSQSPAWTGNHTFSPASGEAIVINSVVASNAQRWTDNTNYTATLSKRASGTGPLFMGTSGSGLGLGANGLEALSIATTGAVSIAAPTSGATFSVTGIGSTAANAPGFFRTTTAGGFGLIVSDGTNASSGLAFDGSHNFQVGAFNANNMQLIGGNTVQLTLSSNGIVAGSATGGSQGTGTINMQGCFVNGVSCGGGGAAAAGSLTGTTLASNVVSSSLTSLGAVTSGSFPAANLTGTTFPGGITASSLTSVGTLSSLAVSGNITMGGVSVGYLNIPPNQQSGSYTAVLSDSGKMVESVTSSPITFTIPSNASVPYPIGTVITFTSVPGSGTVTIAISGSDTLTLAGTASTGSRSLAQSSVATAIKVTATQWNISGAGLT